MLIIGPISVTAASLFGLGLPGVSGIFSGPANCEEYLGPRLRAPLFYVAYGGVDCEAFNFGLTSEDILAGGLRTNSTGNDTGICETVCASKTIFQPYRFGLEPIRSFHVIV